MGDKADRAGIAFTWGWLESIRRLLGADWTVAATGNHDVDSRDVENRNDPTNAVRALHPRYPVDDETRRNEYWTHNFTVMPYKNAHIAILNTCAHHSDPTAAERGWISDETLEYIKRKVDTLDDKVRILICHHHPFRHDAIDRDDYSEADGGPELLRILEDCGDWLVIHGHRHYPTISYSSGTSRSPVILAAGSFSAMLYPELSTRVRNQFTIIDVEGVSPVAQTSGIAARIRSWEYNFARGWVAPQSLEGIPDFAGFGCRVNPSDAAESIHSTLRTIVPSGAFIRLCELFANNPHLEFLSPRDREICIEELRKLACVSVSPDACIATAPRSIFLQHNSC